jgi:hypothetical protein
MSGDKVWFLQEKYMMFLGNIGNLELEGRESKTKGDGVKSEKECHQWNRKKFVKEGTEGSRFTQ